MRAQLAALHELIAALTAQGTAKAAQLSAQAAQIAALQTALLGTAQNPNPSTLNLSLSDPVARPEMQQLLDACNALLNQITRV